MLEADIKRGMRVYVCDHCNKVLREEDKRSETIGNKAFDLCAEDKEEFQKIKNDFFNLGKIDLEEFYKKRSKK